VELDTNNTQYSLDFLLENRKNYKHEWNKKKKRGGGKRETAMKMEFEAAEAAKKKDNIIVE